MSPYLTLLSSLFILGAAHPPGIVPRSTLTSGEPPPSSKEYVHRAEDYDTNDQTISEKQPSSWHRRSSENLILPIQSLKHEDPFAGFVDVSSNEQPIEADWSAVRKTILTDTPHYFALTRKRRAASPAVDSVEDNPSQWKPQPKPQFVTKRGHNQIAPYSPAARDAKSNEIPLSDRRTVAYANRYDDSTPYRRYTDPYPEANYDSRRPLSRRVIYYADLPEIVRPRSDADPRDPRSQYAYDPTRKYPRESRYDDPTGRQRFGPYNRDDWYRYRSQPPPPGPGSYAIIDAERAQPLPSQAGNPYSRPYPPGSDPLRYNRIPAPYQRTAGPLPTAALSQQPYDQYRRPAPNSARLTVGGGRYDEPYRDYNPRQPAPWSMQIGTSLTVNDEGRGPYSPGRRFYVQSQDQGAYPPTRYSRVEDDPRHRI